MDTGAGMYVGGNLIVKGPVSEVEGITVVKGNADFSGTSRSVKFGKAWVGSGFSTGPDAAALNVGGDTIINHTSSSFWFQSNRPYATYFSTTYPGGKTWEQLSNDYSQTLPGVRVGGSAQGGLKMGVAVFDEKNDANTSDVKRAVGEYGLGEDALKKVPSGEGVVADYSAFSDTVTGLSGSLAQLNEGLNVHMGATAVTDRPDGDFHLHPWSGDYYDMKTYDQKQVTFTGDGNAEHSTQVFTLDQNAVDQMRSAQGVVFDYENIPDEAKIVVNVTATQNVEWNAGWSVYLNGTDVKADFADGTAMGSKPFADLAQRVAFNFPGVPAGQTVTINGGSGFQSGHYNADGTIRDTKTWWSKNDSAPNFVGSIIVPNGGFRTSTSLNGRTYVNGDVMLDQNSLVSDSQDGEYKPYPDPYPGEWNSRGDGTSPYLDLERHNFPWSQNMGCVAWGKVDKTNNDAALGGTGWTISSQSMTMTVNDNDNSDHEETDGAFRVDYLEPGTYELKETGVPEGYESDNLPSYTFTIQAGATTSPQLIQTNGGAVDGNRIGNTRKSGTVQWNKVDSDNKSYWLKGSEWKLTKADGSDVTGTDNVNKTDIKDRYGTYEGSQSDGQNDDNAGAGRFTVSNLPWGTYKLTETKTPAGYQSDNLPTFTFTIDATHLDVWINPTADQNGNNGAQTSDGNQYRVTNTRRSGEIDWSKTAHDYETLNLSGSEWTITGLDKDTSAVDGSGNTGVKVNAKGFGTKKIIDNKVDGLGSDEVKDENPESGKFKVIGLPWGTYELKETKAPDGYQLTERTYTFVVNADHTTGTLTTDGDQLKPSSGNGVPNVKNVMQLPLTGGLGGRGVLIVGSALVILGAVIVRAWRHHDRLRGRH